MAAHTHTHRQKASDNRGTADPRIRFTVHCTGEGLTHF